MCVAAQGDVAEAIDGCLKVPIGNEVVIEEQDDDGAIIDDNGHDDLQDQNDIGDDEPTYHYCHKSTIIIMITCILSLFYVYSCFNTYIR